ncbi:hypothetical protein [Chondromyces apiculatus]|uniref:Uncharacterized protein n=1 Tax=Chondromyces apiculatus DSM 436 TaxID=1192034 RepID=A0A017SY65_9BACT|nr:hypothetical protein [Chondromyces apiculatus]EYF01929.1 Hypothetical protein CAP_7697 [Chondromyces apiculatus DSM 436]
MYRGPSSDPSLKAFTLRLSAGLLVGRSALLPLGCNPKANAVAARAANDLACPANEVDLVSLGGSAFMASGCGQSVSYSAPRLGLRRVPCIGFRCVTHPGM